MQIAGIYKKGEEQACHIGNDKHDRKHKEAEIRLLWDFAAWRQSALKMIVLDRVGSIRCNKYTQQIESKNTKADANGIKDKRFYGNLLIGWSTDIGGIIHKCILQLKDDTA
jgi:hypothetical protein